MHDRPSEAIGLQADIEVPGDLQRLEIDDHDVIVGRAGHEGAGAIGLHDDAGSAMADFDALDLFARAGIQNGHCS